MKLSKRLKHIENMVDDGYKHIWDCCCDHGFLGASLLSKQKANNIHFVDIVPELMSDIENKLEQFYSKSASNWQTYCLDVAKLPLTEYQGKHLIIIAGIGSDLMTRMIDSLNQNHSNEDVDYLLCPVNRQYALREKLIELDFSLIDEILIEDKQRFYEILLVSSRPHESKKISIVGDKIWQAKTSEEIELAQRYLEKTIQHYRLMEKNNTVDVSDIIGAYEGLKR